MSRGFFGDCILDKPFDFDKSFRYSSGEGSPRSPDPAKPMFTNEEVDALLALDKEYQGGSVLISLTSAKTRVGLVAATHPEYRFLVQIEINQKIRFKVSLHHQEDNTKIGLMRVCFKGTHINPRDSSRAPNICKPYTGKFFGVNEPHVHVYCERGYKPLAWAIPISAHGFKQLSIGDAGELEGAVREFFTRINVVSAIVVQHTL